MNPLFGIVILIWLAFFGLVGAFWWARQSSKNDASDDPFLAATSGPVTRMAGDRDDGLSDTLRQFDEGRRDADRNALRRAILRGAPKALATLALGGVVLLFLWKANLINGGRERQRVSFSGFSSSKRGFKMGNKKIYARAGQNIVIDYKFESGQGSLMVFVQKLQGGLLPNLHTNALWSQSLRAPGHFSARTPVPESGFYQVFISPHPARGQELLYDVSWKVE